MPSMHLERISKAYGAVAAVSGVSFTVNSGELFFLLGPSGCGKTTVLRVIAGFCDPDEGTLRFGDRIMNRIPAHRRNTGMVFQSYALWPHMSVFENVGYGLEVRGIRTPERRHRVMKMLDLVRLADAAGKSPNQLSGGQQQRVALARALVIQPDFLLLDEPLSNLDANLRQDLREEIRRIHAETGVTAVYVTHDQKEALSIADRIAVMNAGRIEQIGTPRDLYRRPSSRFMAQFLGEANFLPGRILSVDADDARVATPAGTLVARGFEQFASKGAAVMVGIRPECLRIGSAATIALDNHMAARIERISCAGDQEHVVLRLTAPAAHDARFKATLLNSGQPSLEPGGEVTLAFSAQDVMLFAT